MLPGSVDATVQQVEKPKINQRFYYSGKHKFNCMKVQALVSPAGLLIHYANKDHCSIHDYTL